MSTSPLKRILQDSDSRVERFVHEVPNVRHERRPKGAAFLGVRSMEGLCPCGGRAGHELLCEEPSSRPGATDLLLCAARERLTDDEAERCIELPALGGMRLGLHFA